MRRANGTDASDHAPVWDAVTMRVAPLRRKLVASLLDAAVAIVASAAIVGLSIASAVAYRRVRGGDATGASPRFWTSERRFDPSLPVRAALWVASGGLAVRTRNWRSPGFRIVGLRRVDAGSGGPVRVHSAAIAVIAGWAQQGAARRLFRSSARRHHDRMTALRQQVKEIERMHPADPQARHRAVTEFYTANQINPIAGCGWQILGGVLSRLIFAVPWREGRSINDRLTGTAAVVDR